MTWRAIQVGVLVVGLALVFAAAMGIVAGQWLILILAGCGLLGLVAVQVFVVRRHQRRTGARS
jgi:hypothetical protein